MRRPLVGLSFMFAAGIWAGLRYGDAPGLLPVALSAALCAWGAAAALMVLRHDRSAALCVFALAGLMGAALCGTRGAPELGLDTIPGFAGAHLACTVEGAVNQDCMDFAEASGDGLIQFGIWCDSVDVDGTRHRIAQPLRVMLHGVPRYPPVYGERWSMRGTLLRGSDRAGRRGQWMFRTGLSQSRRIGQAEGSFGALSQRLRRAAASVLAHGIEKQQDVTGVINALLLGYRTRLPPDIRQSFSSTGTMHIFAISGLHVAILCSVLVFAISLMRVPRTCRVFALAPAILLYAVATGSRASAVRAGLMAAAYLLAPALGRRPDAVSALALAGILILAWKPEQLTDIGFIFSFAAVAGILAIVPVLENMLQRWLRPDPLAVPDLTGAQPWWHAPALWIGRLAAVSLAAWLTSVPLSLYFFGRFAPIALAANLLVMPLAFLIIVTGCLSLAAGVGIGLWLAGIFNAANVVFVRLLTGGMRVLESVPLGHAEGWRISRAGMALWYALLGIAVLRLRDRVHRLTGGEYQEFDA